MTLEEIRIILYHWKKLNYSSFLRGGIPNVCQGTAQLDPGTGTWVVSYGKRDLSVWERRTFPRIYVQNVMEACQNPTCNHHPAWLHHWELILGTMMLFKLGRQWRVTGTGQRPPPICPMMAPLGKKGDSAGLDGIEHVNERAKVSQS